MARFRLGIIAVLAGSLSGGAAQAARAGEPTTRTFVYKTAKEGPLELTVHFPEGWKEGDRRPAIVYFFGGGWTGGKITQFETQADHLARRGMVTARADYRVKKRHGESITPDRCVEDAKSAVRWIRAHAAKLGVDPDRIVASGGSAGAHIAACTSLTKGLEAPGEDLAVSSRPNALVLYNPVLNFDGVPRLLERVGNDQALGQQISPTLHVSKATPPTLLFYGTDDKLYAQGKEFLARARELGFRAEIFTADGVGHGFFNRAPWREKTTERVDEFLASLGYLDPQPKSAGSK